MSPCIVAADWGVKDMGCIVVCSLVGGIIYVEDVYYFDSTTQEKIMKQENNTDSICKHNPENTLPYVMTPPVHAALIHDWADGAVIQYYGVESDEWLDCVNNAPSWNPTSKYRIKPYPDVVIQTHTKLAKVPGGKFNPGDAQNLRLTYNGFTGKLKKAEVIA